MQPFLLFIWHPYFIRTVCWIACTPLQPQLSNHIGTRRWILDDIWHCREGEAWHTAHKRTPSVEQNLRKIVVGLQQNCHCSLEGFWQKDKKNTVIMACGFSWNLGASFAVFFLSFCCILTWLRQPFCLSPTTALLSICCAPPGPERESVRKLEWAPTLFWALGQHRLHRRSYALNLHMFLHSHLVPVLK